MTLRMQSLGVLAILVLVCCTGQLALADNVTFTQGNQSLLNEENIMFHQDQMGMLIMGFSNITNTEVDFSSTTDVLVAHGGQADIMAQDGLINDITITSPTMDFQGFVFNAFHPADNNDLIVTVVDTSNNQYTFQYGSTNGNNFLTIVDTDGHNIKSITIDSAGGFEALKQNRFGDLPNTTPEPSSLMLFGSGLLGSVAYWRRKK